MALTAGSGARGTQRLRGTGRAVNRGARTLLYEPPPPELPGFDRLRERAASAAPIGDVSAQYGRLAEQLAAARPSGAPGARGALSELRDQYRGARGSAQGAAVRRPSYGSGVASLSAIPRGRGSALGTARPPDRSSAFQLFLRQLGL